MKQFQNCFVSTKATR